VTLLDQARQSSNVIDGSRINKNLELSADICVIGSGAGGAVAAHTLVTAGKDVLIVEEGGYFSHLDFSMNEAEVYPKLYQEGLQRATQDLGIAILQGRAVGGTTVVNWTTCFRTPEDVVDHWRTHHHVGGFKLADIIPHYEWIEDRLCMQKVPKEQMNPNNRKLFEGCKALGWQVDTIKRNVYACMNSGYCGMGCPYNAKRSMLVTLIPDAITSGARLLFRCRIDRLVENNNGIDHAEGTLLTTDGYHTRTETVRIKAKHFIVAGGAINSPALLLRSGINDHDRVGKRTFFHPSIVSVGLYDDPIEAYYGAPQSAASHHFSHRSENVGFFLEAAPLHPVLASTALPGFGFDHHENMKPFSHIAPHTALTIDGFHSDLPGGQVTLRPSGTPLINYPLTPALWESFRFAQKRLAQAQFASGAKSVMTLHDPPLVMRSPNNIADIDEQPFETCRIGVFSAHQMGGCGMGDNHQTAVVRSEDLRHHRLSNLYVMDGSVFPTSLGVNPQQSIYGLVRLMASRLVERIT